MKTIEEIKKAFFELVENNQDWDRMKNGYKWMIENGFKQDIIDYERECPELECTFDALRSAYENKPRKQSLREMHNNYKFDNDLKYDYAKKQFVK